MIDWAKSAKLNDMSAKKLKTWFNRYPKSHKKVFAICDGCNVGRVLNFSTYHSLCHACAVNTPEYCKQRSENSKRYWSDQDTRDKMSESTKKYWAEHPEMVAAIRLKTIARFSDPAERTAHSARRIQYCKDHPEFAEKMSKTITQYYIDHPNFVPDMAKRKKQYHKDHPEWGREHSIRLKQYHRDHPERGREHSVQLKRYFKEHPEIRAACSESLKNSEHMKKAIENMRGGTDVVRHHFIYDYNNPDQHTVEMTRAEHITHHHWMRRNQLEVPKFNASDENRHVFKVLN